ncbi:MAG: hypothetical protein ACREYE_00470 [Gammaproteobacteria bacterium]
MFHEVATHKVMLVAQARLLAAVREQEQACVLDRTGREHKELGFDPEPVSIQASYAHPAYFRRTLIRLDLDNVCIQIRLDGRRVLKLLAVDFAELDRFATNRGEGIDGLSSNVAGLTDCGDETVRGHWKGSLSVLLLLCFPI